MNKSTVVLLIFSLSNLELKQFQYWLKADLHNNRSELIRLLEWIKKFRSQLDLSKMTKVIAYQIAFPNEVYDAKKFSYTMSFLSHQVRDFIIWKRLQTDDVQASQYLLKMLRQRKLNKQFETQIKKTVTSIEHQPYRNATYYYHQYQIQLEQYEYLQTQSRSNALPLKNTLESFTTYSIINILRLQCNILTHKSIAPLKHDILIFEKILEVLQEGGYQNIPSIQVYYKTYQALATLETSFYNELKPLIHQHFNQFPPNEIRDILLLAINFCIKKLNQGEHYFLKEAFNWYKKGFDENVLIKDGELSRFTYNNVIIAGLKLKEYGWTKQFMDNHERYIAKAHRHDTYYFNLALWYQYQNQYNEVLELLQKVNFKDVLHALHAKQLMIKVYYQLASFDALDSLLGSIKVYLYRHKSLGYHRQDYLKLIRYVKKLIELNPNDKVAKIQLRQVIENEKSLLDKRWFLESLGDK